MGRGYHVLFTHLKKVKGEAKGARLRIAKNGPAFNREDWAQLLAVDEPSFLCYSWKLLICLLNFDSDQFFPETRSRWERWMEFRRALEVPYFLVDDGHGHPIVFFSGTDGIWYGVLLDFGLVPGQWSWMVPGDTCISSHEYRPGPTIIKSFLEGLPSGLFDINPRETLTLEEVMEEVLRCYSIEEQARCWIRVYRLAPEDSGDEEARFPLSRLEAERQALTNIAWTLLSPDIRMWDDVIRAILRAEMGHPEGKHGVDDRLAAMRPSARLAFLKALGYKIDPPCMRQIRRIMDVEPGRRRGGEDLVDEAIDYRRTNARVVLEERQRARETLVRAAIPAEVYFTTNIFAAAWQQLFLAVDSEWVLRACQECGLAFLSSRKKRLCETCGSKPAVDRRYREGLKQYRENRKAPRNNKG